MTTCKFRKTTKTVEGRDCGSPKCACTGAECQCQDPSECAIAVSLDGIEEETASDRA